MLGRYLQYLSVFVIVCGITLEATLEAHVGFVMITTGSLLFAVGTKVAYHVKEKRRRLKK